MSAARLEASGPTDSPTVSPRVAPVAGVVRAALGVVLLAILALGVPGAGPVAFVSAGLALVFGGLLASGRSRVLAREPLAVVVLDSLLVGLLVAGTGGGGSPFIPLYFLAALGVARVVSWAKVAVATASMAGSYLVAVGFADGPGVLGTAPVGIGAGFVALFCAAVAYVGFGRRDLAGRERGLSSALAAERDRAARVEGLVSGFGTVLGNSSLEEILAWMARTAHAGCGGSYAHVAVLDGNHHASVLEGNTDACPSWWHPSIQGLVLRACREGEAVRSDEEIHGIGGFLAVPVGPAEGEGRGAVIVGGGEFGAEEERVLALISGAAGPALEAAEGAPGGRDPVSGLPNRASLHRVLRRELSRGRALTVFAVEVGGLGRRNRTLGFAAGDDLLRRVGGRLGRNRRAFRYGGDEFVVVLGGTDEARARRAALAIRQAVSGERGEADNPAVGFVHAGPGDEDPNLVLKSALLALREAKVEPDRVAGFSDPTEAPGAGGRPAGIVEAMIGALEAKDPGIGEHLREVSRISRGIAGEIPLPEEQVENLVAGALLHDVGKIGVPDHILQKPGRLTEEEYQLITRHPALGAEIVAPVGEMAPVLPVVRHHHERFDGKGYPDGLRGEEIPLLARIVSVADAFDSMVRERPYGYSISREAALKEIQANSGSQFAPRVVEALIRVEEDRADRRASSAT
ncbi:MAG TPA: HD domain-containing phosphohydrolase [Rubrobacter sp.]|nr:HD domain-containing phosphohydrolase [Rubrobacter sp.]